MTVGDYGTVTGGMMIDHDPGDVGPHATAGRCQPPPGLLAGIGCTHDGRQWPPYERSKVLLLDACFGVTSSGRRDSKLAVRFQPRLNHQALGRPHQAKNKVEGGRAV